MKYAQLTFVFVVAAALGLMGGLLLRKQPAPQNDPSFGVTSPYRGYIGIYNATTTDLLITDGYGSGLAVDRHGRAIVSPSSSLLLTGS